MTLKMCRYPPAFSLFRVYEVIEKLALTDFLSPVQDRGCVNGNQENVAEKSHHKEEFGILRHHG